MNTNTQKKPIGQTFTAIASTAEIIADFAAKQQKPESDSKNSHEILLALLPGFAAAYDGHTFNVADFAKFGRSYDIPFLEMESFFSKFIAHGQQAGRIRPVPSCYVQEEIFQFV